ncbi:TIGR03905 family TSCPD domain-containing protein [Bacillota bacterium Meth-B3]|nr:TIGR03905 family TSCPD domain-containing protein [Christensenellaceae bacterium]MEA5065708.1 TIGR03905 family TSCPD domain-containing protein [Eubacteriales bacterium]
MAHHTFYPKGVCSTQIDCDIEDGRVYNLTYKQGCNGNLQAVGKLCEGRTVEELVKLLDGIRCGQKATSCSDQLAKALGTKLTG